MIFLVIFMKINSCKKDDCAIKTNEMRKRHVKT